MPLLMIRHTVRRSLSTLPPLTAQHYDIKRGDYSKVNDVDIELFQSVLGDRVLTDPALVEPYNVDWMRIMRGQSKVVLRPKTTQEISKIMRHCNGRKLAVVPQGGNTGLVGGSVPVFDEIIISTSLMNNVLSLDETAGVLVCQSGCVLKDLDNYLSERNLMMPLDLGAKGSCQIGGNVSTNAGGLRLLRYGSLHGNVLGLEAVLASGEVINSLSTVRKDNTGYDIKQLFIGSEGTLGIVTAVSILTPVRPKSVNVALVCCDTFEQVQSVFVTGRKLLGEILSAVEFFDSSCYQLVKKHLSLSLPLSSHHQFYVLIETAGSNHSHDEEKLSLCLEELMSSNVIINGTIATDYTKMKNIWNCRELIAEAINKEGVTYKYDVSLPLKCMYELVDIMRERLKDKALCVLGYGHIGDGNLHFNAVGGSHSKELLDLIEPFIFEWTADRKGSISAEHGLGFKKANFINYSKTDETVSLMRRFKDLLDPKGILNPYKTLPRIH
ncbi:PREDICTED: D-2-hydroxyglutarate dehydrogenase, mitochondrial-like [Amphimedon queenslandica]|uniref:D-2-hydroxyglutarate dehydrogenase, mitochondrial n=2 Tax=Amphimedon queenslandica TaxID=400682 RepID=A0AAN0IBS4_AMPQE|nr:PREDICTED: D-2-hydroxyglutarate dehydrogenase, mitochondrial-like [Amphimedon queenslandica]|eukprot:XP_003384734.1 PREDICTED: D-2-hydroxyglutarate dehydrogenase, mitochondrial-like [Amphimedon queenslandica]